jgi:hypothetical protein
MATPASSIAVIQFYGHAGDGAVRGITAAGW